MSNQQAPATGLQKVEQVQDLAKLTPGQMLAEPLTEQRFIDLYNKVHGTDMGESAYETEKFHFSKQLAEKPDLQKCTTLSLYGCFLDVSVQGLSVDPSKKLCYLIPYNINVGTREQPVWEKRAQLQIAPQGELILRQKAGQIKHADNVVIVYNGDTFEPFMDENGNKRVVYRANPEAGNEIVGAFVRLVRPDDTVDFFWMMGRDIERLKGYSARKNNGNANALYSSQNGGIDPGFLAAKCLKHAFKSYPKVNVIGKMSVLEPENAEPGAEIEIDYGINLSTQAPPAQISSGQPRRMQPNPQAVSDEARLAKATAEDKGGNGTVNYSDIDTNF